MRRYLQDERWHLPDAATRERALRFEALVRLDRAERADPSILSLPPRTEIREQPASGPGGGS